MSQTALSTEWLEQLSDPYAVLGIPVTADDRSILQRYHFLAKQLHPDQYESSNKADQKLATAIFTRLINPAYAELKQTKKRAEIAATLRLKAMSWGKQAEASTQNPLVKKLMGMSRKEAELFYQQAIASYTTQQYQSLTQSCWIIQQLNELNLTYLYLRNDHSFTIEPPHPIAAEAPSQPAPPPVTVSVPTDKNPTLTPAVINYAHRHYQRAFEYSKQGQWSSAVRELRDAIKLEPNNSDYYALLGVVHLRQSFVGMAKVYIRQALKLNPKQPLAVKYAAYLKLPITDQNDPKSVSKALGIAVRLSQFLAKAEAKLSQVLKLR